MPYGVEYRAIQGLRQRGMTQARIKITYRPSEESNKTGCEATAHLDRDDDAAYKIYKMLVDLLTTLDEMRLERDDAKD